MNILLVSQEYPPATAHGGIATQTRQKALGLAAMGHAVTVCSHAADGTPPATVDGGARVVRLPAPDERLPVRNEAARWLLWSVEVAAGIEQLLAESSFDLIDFPDFGGEGCAWLLDRNAGQAPRAVVHLHGPVALLAQTLGWPEPGSELHRVGTFLEGTSLRLCDAVISSSRMSAQACASAYGLDAARIPIVHTGVDVERFRPPPQPSRGAPVILFVGRIAASKGAPVLVDAALQIASEFPGLRLRMIGRDEGGLADRLRARAAARGHPHLLEMPGALPHADLPEEFAAAALFAAPSPCEGGPGFVFLEAMACGLPAIGCAGTGAAESILDGATGLLVPPGDADALAAALRSLLREPARREQMGRAARAAVLEHADTRTCIERLAGLYEDVVSGRTGPPAGR